MDAGKVDVGRLGTVHSDERLVLIPHLGEFAKAAGAVGLDQ